MFWDSVAGVYDIFANVINAKTHRELKTYVAQWIHTTDEVLEVACGTGMLSTAVAPRCKSLIATDYSLGMLQKAAKNCSECNNISFQQANIMSLNYPSQAFDKVIAANVIHLLDEPIAAIHELDRVCKNGGYLIIPTYMSKNNEGQSNRIASTIGKAGADFKRQFTFDAYQKFFQELGYTDVVYSMIQGRIPCAVAVIKKTS